MRIGVLGGGPVGQTLEAGFARQGHEVSLGIREVTAETLAQPRAQARPLEEWQQDSGGPVVTTEEAVRNVDLVVNATNGAGSIERLRMAGAGTLPGKVLVDAANPLDFSRGMPSFLPPDCSGTTSLGERIQAEFPNARVVKCFNAVNAAVMVEPSLVPGEHDLFLCGDDPGAKDAVRGLGRSFGWECFVDLGGIVGARAQEAFVLI